MGARMSVYDAAGNLRPYPYPYNFFHRAGQLPCRFFLANCFFTRKLFYGVLIFTLPMFAYQMTVRKTANKIKWESNRAHHYDQRLFVPPKMPHCEF